MKITGAGGGPKTLELIRKALKANPGCAVVVKRGPDGHPQVSLRARSKPLSAAEERAAQLRRLKARAKAADLLLLKARVEESELLER